MAGTSLSGSPVYGQKFQTGVFSGSGTLYTQLGSAPAAPSAPVPQVTPVTPTYDPKIEANALYGKRIILWALGYGRIGAAPAPLVGPYIHNGMVDFLVSLGVPANPGGTRKIYKIYLDNELAWSSVTGWDGTGALPGDSTFAPGLSFDIEFRQGTLTQAVCSLETVHFPSEQIAYRPQALVQIRNLVFKRYIDMGGKPTPYLAAEIGDTTDGADPADGIGVGEGLARIADFWCGYGTTGFESVDVADITPGYFIAENINIDQLAQNVCGTYRNLDYTHTDKRRIRDRGANVTPDIIFTRDNIVGGDAAITISRTDPSAEPFELELGTVDPDQDYTIVTSLSKRPRDPVLTSASVGKQSTTLSMIMDAARRQAMVTFAHFDRENSRKKVSFRSMAYGYEIQPGDLFAIADIADGIDDEVFKCTETSHGANYEVEIQGQAVLRCRLFVPGGATSTYAGFHEQGASGSAVNFSTISVGAQAGDLVVVLCTGFRSIVTARNLSSATIDGSAATIHGQVVNNTASPAGAPNLAIISLVAPTDIVTCNIALNYDGALTCGSIDVYVLTNYVSPTPTDIQSAAVASGDPSIALDLGENATTFVLWAGNKGTQAAAAFTGVDTEDHDASITTGIAARVASAHQSGMGSESNRAISATSTMDAESIIAASWS